MIAAVVYPISKENLSKLAMATNCAQRIKKKMKTFTPLTVAEKTLEKLLNTFLDKKIQFNKKAIKSTSVEAYSADKIGHEIYEFYLNSLNA